jgi:DNA replication protein DnaC
VRAWLSRAVSDLGSITHRSYRFAGRQGSSGAAPLLRQPRLVNIDEFGFDKIERAECPEAAHLLYKIIASRNQKRSSAMVTNVDFDKWGDYL